MDINRYTKLSQETAVHPLVVPDGAHPHMAGLLYCAAKLAGESGEVSEVIGKALRDDNGTFPPERMTQMVKELGDVYWYLSRICCLLGIDPEHVLKVNLEKLQSRMERGTLHGDGDDR